MSGEWVVRKTFVQGKSKLCEDMVCITADLVAVIDGVSDKTSLTYTSHVTGEEVSSGRFAAEVIADVLAAGSLRDPDHAIDKVSDALDTAIRTAHGDLPACNRPGAVFLAFQSSTGILFGVGDCSAAWTDQTSVHEHRSPTPLDCLTSSMRAVVIAATRWDGTGEDPGRAAILPLLRLQPSFANLDGEWGYGVINGTPVPPRYRIIRHINADRLVLATDGYPRLVFNGLPDFVAAEQHLAAMLAKDPLCVSELRSTKMPRHGDASFDDRTWLEVERI